MHQFKKAREKHERESWLEVGAVLQVDIGRFHQPDARSTKKVADAGLLLLNSHLSYISAQQVMFPFPWFFCPSIGCYQSPRHLALVVAHASMFKALQESLFGLI